MNGSPERHQDEKAIFSLTTKSSPAGTSFQFAHLFVVAVESDSVLQPLSSPFYSVSKAGHMSLEFVRNRVDFLGVALTGLSKFFCSCQQLLRIRISILELEKNMYSYDDVTRFK